MGIKSVCMALIASSLLWSACQKEEVLTTPNTADQNFIQEAAFSTRAGIQQGALAASMGSYIEIKRLGQVIVNDYGTALDELKALANERRIEIPMSLKETDQKTKDRLARLSGRKFDSTYLHTQIKAHQEAENIFQKELDNGADAKIKAYAGHYLSIICQHLQKADTVQQQL